MPAHTETSTFHWSHESETELSDDIQSRLAHIESLIAIEPMDEYTKVAILHQQREDLAKVMESDLDEIAFGIVRASWDKTASITDSDTWKDGRFTPEHQAAQKLYAAGMFEQFGELDTDLSDEAAQKIHRAYFSSSDALIDFTGGYHDQLDLLTLSRRSHIGRREAGAIAAGLIYNGTFGTIRNDLQKTWQSSDSIEAKLAKINTFSYLLLNAEREMYDTRHMQEQLLDQFQEIADDDSNSAFIRLAAQNELQMADDRQSDEYEVVSLHKLPQAQRDEIMRARQARQEQYEMEQDELRRAFPQLNADKQLYRLASDACAEVDRGRLGLFVTTRSQTADMHRPERAEQFSPSDIVLLTAAHHRNFLEAVERESGVDLRQLDLDTQLRFFRFMSEADADRYARLVQTLQMQDEDDRYVLANAFLSTEFGDDIGDMILDIAEKDDTSKAMDIFAQYMDIRQAAHTIAATYDNDEYPNFAACYNQAWNKRCAELMVLLSDDLLPRSDREDAHEALRMIAYAAREIADATSGEFEFTQLGDVSGHATLRSTSRSVTKTIRPTGASARVGDRVKIPVELMPKRAEHTRNKTLSVRLDRDEYGISLDIGSSATNGSNNPSGVGVFVAEQLAKGEARIALRRQLGRIGVGLQPYGLTTITLHGNHVREAFAGLEDITEGDFAQLVREHASRCVIAAE